MPHRPRYSLRRLYINLGGVFMIAAICIACLFLTLHIVVDRCGRSDQIECQVPK